MFDLRAAPSTDPLSVYRYRDGLYAADLLTCAIVSLDLFSWLDSKPATPAQIRERFSTTERPTDVMLTLFVAMGLLSREGDHVRLTDLAREHLVQSSPWFLGPYYASLKDRPVCQDFLRVLQTDKPANWGSFKNEKDWTHAMEDPVFARNFTAAMDCRGVYLGQAVAKALDCSEHKRLLDIAGGSGIYACSITSHHPHLTAAVFEKSPVDRVARKAIAERNCSEKVSVIEGDMFKTELPGEFDLHLISNVLHDWDTGIVQLLIEKSFRALAPGGLLVIHDAHIDEDKCGPLPVASYSAMLMHSTEGKCYSLGELYPLLGSIGFRNARFTPTAADRSIITVEKPA